MCSITICVARKLGLSRWLQWTFVSSATGLRKPAPEAFAHAIAALGAADDPGRLLFVDDRAGNVQAARAAGMEAIQFRGSAAELELALRQRGLVF